MYEITDLVATGATFQTSHFLVRAARLRDADAIWAFVQANPEYELTINGALPARDTLIKEFFEDRPPSQMTFSTIYKLLAWNKTADGTSSDLAGLLDICADLMAKGVWHIGYFQVATAKWGSGHAQALYDGLEVWMLAHGAQVLRLNVADVNRRARRFWERQGYQLVRSKPGVQIGQKVHTLHTLVKLVSNLTLDQYKALVPHDAAANPDPPPAG